LRVPVSRHPRAYGFAARDVNIGTAGIVLVLAELVTVFDDPSHRETLAHAARWLQPGTCSRNSTAGAAARVCRPEIRLRSVGVQRTDRTDRR
jgi:hypothetical protein